MQAEPSDKSGNGALQRAGDPAPAPQRRPPRVNSGQLFGPGNEVEIEHVGAIYRLRRTALGKLILTK